MSYQPSHNIDASKIRSVLHEYEVTIEGHDKT